MTSTLTKALLTVSLCTALGCTGGADGPVGDGIPGGDAPPAAPGDRNDDGPADTEPDAPTPLSLSEVDVAFNDAFAAAAAGDTEVAVARTAAAITLDGELVRGDAVITFDELVVAKAPYTVTGSAMVASRGQISSIEFEGEALGEAILDGDLLGEIEARFPALAEFADAAAEWLMGTAFSCEDVQFGGFFTGEPISARCALTDDEGEEVAAMSIEDFAISLQPLGMSGTISATGPGFDTQLVFDGLTVKVLVDGEVVKEITLPNLLDGWM